MSKRVAAQIALVGVLLTSLLAGWAGLDAAPAQETKAQGTVKTIVKPFAKKYCADCHSGDAKEGGFSFDDLPDFNNLSKGKKAWRRILAQLESNMMPPADSAQPSQDHRQQVIAWLKGELAKETARTNDPGRVTVRRFNRAEYNNTIRDLLMIESRPADDFPVDNSGYGFDTIGDVLSFSPLLMEKMMRSAEQLAELAIVDPKRSRPGSQRIDPSQMKGGSMQGSGRVLATNGEVSGMIFPNKGGQYTLRVLMYADQAGKELAKMSIKLGNKEIRRADVKGTQDQPETFEIKTTLAPGRQRIAISFLNDFWDEASKKDRNLHIVSIDLEAPIEISYQDLPESHKQLIPNPPDLRDVKNAAQSVVKPFLKRAFRRPPKDAEVERYCTMIIDAVKSGNSFEEGMRTVVQAVLVSPNFLFRWELDFAPRDPSAARELTGYEVANRLSYFLWSTMPDNRLFELAESKQILNPRTLESEIKRMLIDPRAQSLIENFAGQWLELRKLSGVSPDPGTFKTFDDRLRAAMKTESEMFFDFIMKQDRSVLEFLDADYTFLNEQLAKHYGINGVYGKKFRKVTLADGNRGGVITQGSFLTITSNPTRTSPVKRGKWILEQLLNDPPPPPPPGVPELADDHAKELKGSLRERMEQHRSKPGCVTCHQRLDPLGFGLETFDGVGSFRTKDGPAPVNASGTLPTGESFNGPAELKKILLKRKDQFVRCLTEKLLTYGLGRGIEDSDAGYIQKMVDEAKQSEYRFSALITAMVKSDLFIKRRGESNDE